MGDKSGIEWTDASWNPTTGCDRVSPGCTHCYAATLAPRLKAMAIGRGEDAPGDPYMRDGDLKSSNVGFGLMMHESRLDLPLKWQRPRKIFVNSMSDLFHPEVTDEFIDDCFAVMMLAPQHTFQVLTKRPERMRTYLSDPTRKSGIVAAADRMRSSNPTVARAYRAMITRSVIDRIVPTWPLPNVWIGTSVENARFRTRIDELRETPAAVRFLSCEPLLGPLTGVATSAQTRVARSYSVTPGDRSGLDLTGIDWIIVGGESGRGARVMKEDWVRDIVAACREQGVRPFVKQFGSVWAEAHGQGWTHGGNWDNGWPEDLRVREYPEALVPA